MNNVYKNFFLFFNIYFDFINFKCIAAIHKDLSKQIFKTNYFDVPMTELYNIMIKYCN